MRRWLVITFVLGLSLAHAQALDTATWQGEIDGVQVWITVVSRGHDIPADTIESEPWWRWGNTTGDAYLFATKNPTNVRLIVSFAVDGDGGRTARFYTSATPIRHDLRRPDLGLTLHPVFTMEARDGQWLVDGATSYNLSIWQDGLGSGHPLVVNGAVSGEPDGVQDLRIRVQGERPGVADWQTSRLLIDPRPTWSVPRFGVIWRFQDDLPFDTSEPTMPSFPYLGIVERAAEWWVRNPPPFHFDPVSDTLTLHPIPGFHNGGMYTVNSISYPPNVSFEAPFAFYNFDDSTRHAHLLVRAVTSPGPDPRLGGLHRTTFRYAWKVDDEHWTYALFVAGFHEYDEEIVLGEERFTGISPERLPDWVAGRAWPVVTFVETMDERLSSARGSEGIYFYNVPQSDAIIPWLGGVSERAPVDLTMPYLPDQDVLGRDSERGIPVGYRGQYSAEYFRVPELVYSEVDRAFHLRDHQGGVWNLGDGHILRYHNLSPDAGTDGWTRERLPEAGDGTPLVEEPLVRAAPGLVDEALYAFDEHLLYAGNDRVVLLELNDESVAFGVETPIDRETWTQFRDSHEQFAGEHRDPFDLGGWLDAFDGERSVRANAWLLGYRVTDEGVRFEITVEEGEETGGAAPLHGMSPGHYVMRYHAATRSWTRDVAQPVDLEVRLQVDDPHAFAPASIELVIDNRSNRDVLGPAHVQIDDISLSSQTLLVPDGGRVSQQLVWVPQRPGPAAARLEFGGRTYDLGPIDVTRGARATGLASLALSPRGDSIGLAAVLGAVVVLVLLGVWATWRRL